jgi:hypothetical protein
MTINEKRIAIAEACGWKCDKSGGWNKWSHPKLQPSNTSNGLPDYLNDLNAMNEAEWTLDTVQYRQFADELWESARRKARTSRTLEHYLSATAAQRFDALGKTLNLWT